MRHFLMILLVVASIAAGPRLARAGAVVTASPLAAGCTSSRHRCHVQIDSFTLQIPVGRQLASFQVAIGATTVYDFRPDLSNPPSGAYTPTLPRLGFAASCDHPYTATLRATDSGDAEPVVVGQTDSFACPVAVPEASAPALGMVALLALRALAGGGWQSGAPVLPDPAAPLGEFPAPTDGRPRLGVVASGRRAVGSRS